MQGKGKGNKMKPKKERPEFDQHIVDLARVTRVTEGGKHLSFRACVVIGDRNGRVGFGVEKGPDVQIAVEKAVNQAKKNIIRVPLVSESIPHRVEAKYKAAKVMLKPAPKGSGVIAGSAIRVILEMAGVPNASSKMLGKTSNKIANVKAVFQALQSFNYRSLNGRKQKERVDADVTVPEEKVEALKAKTGIQDDAPQAKTTAKPAARTVRKAAPKKA